MGSTDVVERAAEPASGRLTLAIVGLDQSENAADLVTRTLENVPGVARAYFNGDTEMAYIEYRESEVTTGKVLAALEQAGLNVSDVTVRSTAPGDAFPPQVRSEVQRAPGAEEFAIEDHSCCGPTATETPARTEASAQAAANDTSSRDRSSNRAQAQSGWPFKVRLGFFLTATALVLGPALWLVRPMPSSAMGADYSVNMSMTGFTPPNFSIPAGKPVSLRLNNVDSPFHGVVNGALHQFAIDKLDIDVRLDGKQSTVITLPALEPGTYEFYCNVCCGGKVNPSMRGTITVGGVEAREGASQR